MPLPGGSLIDGISPGFHVLILIYIYYIFGPWNTVENTRVMYANI
jgi:hypothetical protein